MTEQILKYLSPIALAGLIWGIFQFFQKRKYQKRDLRRQEILKKYEEFHSILNLIRNEYLKLMIVINQTALTFRNKTEQLKDDSTTNEDQSKLNKIDWNYDLIDKQLNDIEKVGYNKDMHKDTLLEISDTLKNRNKQIKKERKKLKKSLKKTKEELQDLNLFLQTKNEENLSDLKNISEKLQSYILQLNEISLIGINVKNSPEILIFLN